ncbi:TPA: hypothetical protein CPT79_02910 [Candidatus Gastranaerophilales bacterium HUM_6]|nr:unknown [Fusobacterium sp. CAG:815]DAA92481.1 MAG TPA: hypothetical protein CPT79_02910 [Candidatus Gastranaerophilales bacterium HUM_6]DAA93981.1 MAG TPA: hypothetical protein CPT93_02635 [Candidatus Gastranaerophilales bacterium HUM_7]DAB05815.1 MAG TPA: hypothetical protein CPT78_06175 [Candidatus Gastranaerophilales bacterium HUM_14]
MINKVELGSVKNNRTPKYVSQKNKGQTSFTGLGSLALKGIQKCEESPMINVAVLDLSTAILPRTFFETFIGSKKKDENGNETRERKLNIMGGFEAFRREGSGLLINCMIPSFIVMGAAKLLNRPIMGAFNKSNLTRSWANGDTINCVSKYYKNAQGASKEDRVFSTLKSMFDDIEGVDGDIGKGGLKKFKEIFANDEEYTNHLRKMAKNIVSEKPEKGYTTEMYKYLVSKSGIAENIKFSKDSGFFSSSLGHLCDSVGDVLHGASKEGILTPNANITANEGNFVKYLSKAKHLVNAKSIAGLGMIIPLAVAAQPINRWITHKLSGKKGAPIYNDDKERILTPEEKKQLTARKFIDVPLMWGVAALSMLMDRPSLKMFQFKNIFPTMDQARIISAATFSSRLAAAEDKNELHENTIRDIATFSSFYFLGDYAAKGIATFLEKHNKDGIKLINRLKDANPNDNIMKKFWNWAKHTKMKSTDELSAISNEALRTKAKNLRAICQAGNLAFSLLSLGIFIPLYTRTQTNKKEKMQKEQAINTPAQSSPVGTTTSFTQNLMKDNTKAFKAFLG